MVGIWGCNERFGDGLAQKLMGTHPATGVHNYLGAVATGDAKERDPVAEGHWSYYWMGEVEHASLGRPSPLHTLVFRPMWNLVNGRGWSMDDVELMARTFVDGIKNSPTGERHVLGYVLGDDFSNFRYDDRWDGIVEQVHGISPNVDIPFYFSNHFASPTDRGGIYNHGARVSQRYSALIKWLRVFGRTGARAVFMPQFFPQAQNTRDVIPRWRSVFEALSALKQRPGVPDFDVQPVIQASAYSHPRGTTGPELRQQLDATLGFQGDLDIDGVWLMAWTAMDANFGWGAESHWRKGHNYADVVGEFLDGQD